MSGVEGQPTRTLADLGLGESGVVASVAGDHGAAQRLLEMGLTAGTPVKLVRVAPLGDPMDVLLRGYHLSIRKSDARHVALEEPSR